MAAVQPAADPMDYPSFSKKQLLLGQSELQLALKLVNTQVSMKPNLCM